MNLELKDKWIIVTGGALGIGQSIVRVLAAEGAIPVIVGRNEENNKALTNELINDGWQAGYVTAELTQPDECKKAVDENTQRQHKVTEAPR